MVQGLCVSNRSGANHWVASLSKWPSNFQTMVSDVSSFSNASGPNFAFRSGNVLILQAPSIMNHCLTRLVTGWRALERKLCASLKKMSSKLSRSCTWSLATEVSGRRPSWKWCPTKGKVVGFVLCSGGIDRQITQELHRYWLLRGSTAGDFSDAGLWCFLKSY